MKLQYSMTNSMGIAWINVYDTIDGFVNQAVYHHHKHTRQPYDTIDEFIEQAVLHHKHTRQQILTGLLSGKRISIGSDWDAAQIRDLESAPISEMGVLGDYSFSTINNCI